MIVLYPDMYREEVAPTNSATRGSVGYLLLWLDLARMSAGRGGTRQSEIPYRGVPWCGVVSCNVLYCNVMNVQL